MFSLYSKYKVFSSPASRFARLSARLSHPVRCLDVLRVTPRMSAGLNERAADFGALLGASSIF